MTPTIEDAEAKFGEFSGPAMDSAVKDYLQMAEELDGIEVAIPDWPEAAEAAKRHPDKLSLGPARGPQSHWRRLSYIGDQK